MWQKLCCCCSLKRLEDCCRILVGIATLSPTVSTEIESLLFVMPFVQEPRHTGILGKIELRPLEMPLDQTYFFVRQVGSAPLSIDAICRENLWQDVEYLRGCVAHSMD